MRHTLDEARAAKRALGQRLKGVSEVTGLGLTEVGDDYAVQVYLSKPVARSLIPENEGSVPVKVDVVGTASTVW